MIKEFVMAFPCSMLERNGKCIQNFGLKPEMKGRPRLRNKVRLKWMLKKQQKDVGWINLDQDEDQ
jgi:hypothetical protein